MTYGFSSANLANKWLNILRGTAFSAPANLYVVPCGGDPGPNGTANPSAITTRSLLSLAASAGGAIAMTGTQPAFTAVGTEVLQGCTVWDALTAGNFLWSFPLSVQKSVSSGDPLTLTSCGIALVPIAA